MANSVKVFIFVNNEKGDSSVVSVKPSVFCLYCRLIIEPYKVISRKKNYTLYIRLEKEEARTSYMVNFKYAL